MLTTSYDPILDPTMKTAPLPLIATLALGFTASVNATPISGDPMMGVVGTGFGDTNTGLIESQQGTLNLLTDSNLSTSNDTWNRGGSTATAHAATGR